MATPYNNQVTNRNDNYTANHVDSHTTAHTDNHINDKMYEHRASHDSQMRNALTNTLTLTPEVFERLYLGPKTQVTGDLRTTFANPTPIALLGFSVGLFPLSIAFMNWGGSGGFGVATTCASIWFGGCLLFLAGIGEFFLGNTFPMLVFFGYGAHFLTQATTFVPMFNALGFFSPSGDGAPTQGVTPVFQASFAFYPLAMGMLSFVYLVGSLRTNACFFLIFVVATIGFELGAAGFFLLSYGHTVAGTRCIYGLGACFFIADLIGWYLTLGAVIQIMELPIPDLPVYDLSTRIKARPRGVIKQE